MLIKAVIKTTDIKLENRTDRKITRFQTLPSYQLTRETKYSKNK